MHEALRLKSKSKSKCSCVLEQDAENGSWDYDPSDVEAALAPITN